MAFGFGCRESERMQGMRVLVLPVAEPEVAAMLVESVWVEVRFERWALKALGHWLI